jgi:hypothetical protein
MKHEGVDWEALLERRLAEARREKQAEAQAAEPAPGPEAAAEVISKFRAATEGRPAPGGASGQTTRIFPVEFEAADDEPEPPVPREDFAHVRKSSRRHRVSRHRLRRTLFYAVLLALFMGGLCLTFWPQLRQLFSFVAPDRETVIPAGGVLVAPDAGGKPVEPAPTPKTAPEKTPPPETKPDQEKVTPHPAPEKKPEPVERPAPKPEEKKPPAEAPKPAEPAMPEMPKPPPPPDLKDLTPPKPPELPKPAVPAEKGETRPVDPAGTVG